MLSPSPEPFCLQNNSKKKVKICVINTDRRKSIKQVPFTQYTSLFNDSQLPEKISIQSNSSRDGSSCQQGAEEFGKLLEITSRCMDYYARFMEQKRSEIKIVKQAFADIHQSLNSAFEAIIAEVKTKHQQITGFLGKKQEQLLQIKQKQEKELTLSLEDIKSVHLANLLTDSASCGKQLGVELCNYANTLHKFYESMQNAQKLNFRETVDETVAFINNIITEEIKFIIYERIPSKSLTHSFSFNDGLGFGSSQLKITVDEDFNDQSIKFQPSNSNKSQAWTQTLCLNESSQKFSGLGALTKISQQQLELRDRIKNYMDLPF